LVPVLISWDLTNFNTGSDSTANHVSCPTSAGEGDHEVGSEVVEHDLIAARSGVRAVRLVTGLWWPP